MSRCNVEHAISAVAVLGSVAAGLQTSRKVDIFRIELRSQVGGDVGVWDGYAIDGPGHLVTAVHVQHVVRDIRWPGTKSVIISEAIGGVRSRRLQDLLTDRRSSAEIGIQILGASVIPVRRFPSVLATASWKCSTGACLKLMKTC